VIKIRYADLPAGLHIRAEPRGKDTIIYLLPGLTAAQRQAALRRARSSARMGQGPRLPVAGVVGAVMVDRMRTTLRNGAAAMRGHPAMFVPPLVIIMTAAVAYILLVSVNIRMHDPQASGPQRNPVPAAVPAAGGGADDPAGRTGSGSTSRNASGQSQRTTHKRSGGSQGGSPSPSPTPSPVKSTSAPSPSPSPPAAASPTPTAGGVNSTGSGSGLPGAGGVCFDPGPPGECQSP
jgi:hypothetical protein